MSNEGKARFTYQPQRIQDLDRDDAEATEHCYEIVMHIMLETLDYVRFTTNMCARRRYFEAYEELCSSGDPFKCILVYPSGYEKEGILVVPGAEGAVAYAARV